MTDTTNEVKPDEYEKNREYYDHVENYNRHTTINRRNRL